MLAFPVVLDSKADLKPATPTILPTAVLKEPDVFEANALLPTAVLSLPVLNLNA